MSLSLTNGAGAMQRMQRVQSAGYWLATIAASALFFVPGVALLAQVPHFVDDMAHLGFPTYFLGILGAWKMCGAAAILAPGLPRLKEWAYAGMTFDATSAAIARFALADGFVKILLPLAIAAIVLASWSLRPPARRLARG